MTLGRHKYFWNENLMIFLIATNWLSEYPNSSILIGVETELIKVLCDINIFWKNWQVVYNVKGHPVSGKITQIANGGYLPEWKKKKITLFLTDGGMGDSSLWRVIPASPHSCLGTVISVYSNMTQFRLTWLSLVDQHKISKPHRRDQWTNQDQRNYPVSGLSERITISESPKRLIIFIFLKNSKIRIKNLSDRSPGHKNCL